jgi:WD40 repeat protein
VILGVADPNANTPKVITLNGTDGSVRSQWTGNTGGGIYGVDCTDDGSQALVAQADPPAGSAHLIDTATGNEITSFPTDSGGGWYHLSGDGSVVVIGGFNFKAFVKVAGVYQQRIFYAAASEWFGFGSAVSHDGTTVAALSHDYVSNYLVTKVRIWDVASHQLLHTVATTGSGTYQDSAAAGALSDDGSRFACASWGDQAVTHPQVRVFDRALNLIGSITTSGSAMSLDLSPDGQYILAGNKSVHANVFGYGGAVTLLQIPRTQPCYPNCDASTAPPILNINDFQCFINKFAVGDSYANCDGSTIPPLLNVNDFQCFLNAFAVGCS